MKYIKTFEYNLYKISSTIVVDIWNELWKNHRFQYPTNNPNIIFESKYFKDNDEMQIRILKFNGEYMSYVEVGNKFFHGTDEDEKDFTNWLYSLNLIQK